jgi:hypothetical protein
VFAFAAKFGIIGGAAVVAIQAVILAIGADPLPVISSLIMVGALVWGQWAYRQAGDPPISYGETFGLGILVLVCFNTIALVYALVLWNLIDPGITERVIAQAQDAIRQQGLPDDQVQAAMDIQKLFIGPVATPFMGFVSSMLIGTLIALITSIFTKNNNAAS